MAETVSIVPLRGGKANTRILLLVTAHAIQGRFYLQFGITPAN